MEFNHVENFQQHQELLPKKHFSEAELQDYLQQMKALQTIKEKIKSEYLKAKTRRQGSKSPKPGIVLTPAAARQPQTSTTPHAASEIDGCSIDDLLEVSEELSRSGHDIRGVLQQAIETIEVRYFP